MIHKKLLFLNLLWLASMNAILQDQGPLFDREAEKGPKKPNKTTEPLIKLDQKKTASQTPSSGITNPIHLKLNHLEYTQYPVAPQDSSYEGNSGYHALKNALLSLKLSHAAPQERDLLASQFKNPSYEADLFASEESRWRKQIIEFRKNELATQYLKDRITLAIKGAKKISYHEITSFDFTPLYLEEAVVVFEKSPQSGQDEVATLLNLIPSITKTVVATADADEKKSQTQVRQYRFSKESILNAFKTEIAKSTPTGRTSFLERSDILELYFETLTEISYTIESAKNENTILVNGTVFHTHKHEGPFTEQESMNGDWLSEFELKELLQREKADVSSPSFKELQEPVYVECLEFPLKNSAERVIHARKLQALNAAVAKNRHARALIFISVDGHWISCVLSPKKDISSKDPFSKSDEIIKSKPKLSLIVTDSKNQDQRIEPAVMNVMNLFENDAPKKTAKDSSKDTSNDDFLNSLLKPKENKSKDDEKGAEKVNYDAPLAGYGLEDLPSLEDLFGGKIPNNIQIRIRQIKELTKEEIPADKKQNIGTIIKNCTLFYGPPGTGKSTIAYVMTLLAAQLAGHDIDVVYAGGGDFRDAYQGSGKAKLDALFAEAVTRKNPCVIIIDEVDGTSSKLEPRSSTQEDNRAIKSLITTLDKYRYNRGIYVICTTNYPEKIDPAILRRFSSIEIPLPTYQMRKRTLEYYLKKNGVEIKAKDPQAVSPAFLDSFATATHGMSGDALSDIVNNAVHELRLGLNPEKGIDLSFRFNSIDLRNRSLASNVAPLLALPVVPFAHLFDRYPATDLDKHLYAQFLRHHKLKKDLDEQQVKKALEEYKGKQLPLLARWSKIAESSIISNVAAGTAGVFIVGGIIWAAKKLYDKTYQKTGGNIQLPWVRPPAPLPATI